MPETRRHFIGKSLSAALATIVTQEVCLDAAWADSLSKQAGNKSDYDLATDEDFWYQIQQAFTVDRSLINFNNGGVSPAPRIVQESLQKYLDFSNQAPTHNMWSVLSPQVEYVRRRLATSFGCDPEEMAIVRNSSEGLEIALFGVHLKSGDEVLTTDQDYGRMLTTLEQRVRREGIVLKKFPIKTPTESMEDIVKGFEKNITPKTKVILVCHIVNITGQIFPIKEICKIAHERGVLVIVDGAHSYEHFPFTLQDLQCDYYATSLHKWCTAPFGTGFLYVKKDLVKKTWPLMAATDKQEDDIRKFEEIGTHPVPNKLGISSALTFNQGIGINRKIARLRYLRNRWVDRIKDNPNVTLYTNLNSEHSGVICNFSIKNINSQELSKHLFDKYRIITAFIGHPDCTGVRVTPGVYSTIEEIDLFGNVIERIASKGQLI